MELDWLLQQPGKQALEWNPQGKRQVRRSVTTWRRSVEEEFQKANIAWNAAKRTTAKSPQVHHCKRPLFHQECNGPTD